MAQHITWGSWTLTSISGASLANSSSLVSTPVSINNTVAAMVSIEATFGATVNWPLFVYFQRGSYAGVEDRDNSYAASLDGLPSTPGVKVIPIATLDWETLTFDLHNISGSTITAITLAVKTAVVNSV